MSVNIVRLVELSDAVADPVPSRVIDRSGRRSGVALEHGHLVAAAAQ